MGIKNSFFEWMFFWFLNKNKNKNLRIIGSNSLKHPSGDIHSVKVEKREVILALNEMSLCGADSPLSDNFLRGIRAENENSLVLAEFLNMLQHYLAILRFNAILEKSCFLMHSLESKKWQNRFAMYSEKFSQESLRRFFVNMFTNAQISVHCFEPLVIENPAVIFLGKVLLNGTWLLGKTCTSLTSAMRVDVSEISLEQIIKLKKEENILNVKFPFNIKLNFRAKVHNTEVCRLGSKKLSENFWIGNKNFEDFKWEKWL